MQMEVALLPRVEGTQAREVSCVPAATRVNVVVRLVAPVPAVIVAV